MELSSVCVPRVTPIYVYHWLAVSNKNVRHRDHSGNTCNVFRLFRIDFFLSGSERFSVLRARVQFAVELNNGVKM